MSVIEPDRISLPMISAAAFEGPARLEVSLVCEQHVLLLRQYVTCTRYAIHCEPDGVFV